MHRAERRFHVNPWVLAAIAVIIFMVVAFFLQLSSQGGELEGSAQPSGDPTVEEPRVTPNPTNSDVPSASADEEEYEEEVVPVADNDCSNILSLSEYDDFVERLYAFEAINQMPESQKRLDQMVPYVTNAFLELNSTIGPVSESAESLTVELDKEASVMGCEVSTAAIITAKIVPVITVLRDGSVVNGPLKLSTHYTSWVLIDSVWYVNQDQ